MPKHSLIRVMHLYKCAFVGIRTVFPRVADIIAKFGLSFWKGVFQNGEKG